MLVDILTNLRRHVAEQIIDRTKEKGYVDYVRFKLVGDIVVVQKHIALKNNGVAPGLTFNGGIVACAKASCDADRSDQEDIASYGGIPVLEEVLDFTEHLIDYERQHGNNYKSNILSGMNQILIATTTQNSEEIKKEARALDEIFKAVHQEKRYDLSLTR